MEKFDKKISLNQGFGVVLRDGKCRRPVRINEMEAFGYFLENFSENYHLK